MRPSDLALFVLMKSNAHLASGAAVLLSAVMLSWPYLTTQRQQIAQSVLSHNRTVCDVESPEIRRKVPAAGFWGLADSLENPEAWLEELANLSCVWSEAESAAALRFLHKRDLGAQGEGMVISLLGNIVQHKPEAAFAWLGELPQDAFRQKALTAALAVLARKDPMQTAKIALLELSADPSLQTIALVDAVQGWASREPRQAAEWVAAFPPGPPREAVLTELTKTWRRLDEPAALAWLSRLPAEEAARHTKLLLDSPLMTP
jgi:hypothetical protein